MSENGRNEIIYEEGWRGNVTAAHGEPSPEETPPAPKRDGTPLLISMQLILCAVAALVLLLLKAMDSPAYHGFMDWYRDRMNRPVISQEFFEGIGVDRLSSADEVTVEASADELAPR